MHSLRVKVTAITVAAILVSFGAFFVASFFTVGDSIDVDSVEKMHLLSQNAQQSLDDYLDSIEQSVETASRIAVDSLDGITLVECGVEQSPKERTAAQQKRLDDYMRDQCAQLQKTLGSIAVRTNGIVSYYYCVNPAISASEHGFFYSSMGKAGFERQKPIDVDQIDPDGLAHNAWYHMTVTRGRPSWIGPYEDWYLGNRVVESYLIPVYKTGALIGVLGMDIPLDTLTSQMSSIKVYETGFAFLADAQGNVLYHPTLKRGDAPASLTGEIRDALARQTSSGDQLYRFNKNGEEWQLSFSTLSNGMKVVVEAPVNEIAATWHHQTTSVVLIAIGLILVFTPLILLAMREVIKPLQRLSVAARRLSEGDYDAKLDYEGDDELGTLTASFKQMRDSLKTYISDLNNRAYADALTHVKNLGAFEIYCDRLNDAITGARDDEEPSFALVMFDCNKLKDINDQYGHECGDVYLQTASKLICRTYAHSPVFRVGGDEFVALLQHQDYDNRDELLQRFDRMGDEVNERAVHPWERANIAKGMAVYRLGEDESVEAVLRRADNRMYEDKRKSKSRS